MWGKLVNCGQNCISPDYLLIHKSKADALLPALTQAVEEQLGQDPEQSGLSKLVAEGHVKRAVELIQDVEDRAKNDNDIQILCGGSMKCNSKRGFVAPTLILNPPMDSRVMKEEIFSPILPILVIENREQAVKIINNMPGTPLGLYVFTNSDGVFTEMTQKCRSGTAVRNDSLIQFAGPHLHFGGLGTSGLGRYRGEASFQAFSHMLPSMYRPVFPGADMNGVRCHPVKGWKSWFILRIGSKLPDIPVMKSARRAAFVGLLAWSVASFVPGAGEFVKTGRITLADGLQHVVNVLRG